MSDDHLKVSFRLEGSDKTTVMVRALPAECIVAWTTRILPLPSKPQIKAY